MAYQAFIDQKRTFGVEIECFGVTREELRFRLAQLGIEALLENHVISSDNWFWIIGEDGTIGSDPGIELKSPKLAGLGSDGILSLCHVVDVLNKIPKLDVDKSCSLHVHWDVSDYTGWDLIQLLKIYAKYEPVIDLFLAEDRRGDRNIHCRSLVKKDGFSWIDRLYDKVGYAAYEVAAEFESTQFISPVTSFPTARHHKLNPVSVLKYGTVEFRQHQGTLDWEAIKNWILFTGQLVNRAKSDIEIGQSKVTLGDMIKFFRLTDTQMDRLTTKESNLLAAMRDYYKKIYRENKKNA